jgi:hypothetical protein
MKNNYDPVTHQKAIKMALDNEYLTEGWEVKQCAKAMYHAMKWDESTRESTSRTLVESSDSTADKI